MTEQLDLFPDERCGNCVHRNAAPADDHGTCTPTPGVRHHREALPCVSWFGLAQLQLSLYGSKRAA